MAVVKPVRETSHKIGAGMRTGGDPIPSLVIIIIQDMEPIDL